MGNNINNAQIFELQKDKNADNLKTAYIFKGLGLNLIPFSPNKKQLAKIKECIKEMLNNRGENADEENINDLIGKNPKIGLTLTLRERKLVNALTIFIGNSTLMDILQFNKYYKKNNKDYKIEKIDYSNMDFKISVKDMNKIFGRSIKEKTEKGNINIVESLSKKKFFLINNKGKIKYEKAFSMIIIGDYLKFKFNSYLIGRVYDMRKNFFEDIETMYEAIFFELLFNKTKTYNKKPIDKFIFTTRSILKDLVLEELVKAHKIHVISILNTCFSKAFKKGIFTEKFEFSLENFKKDDKTIITIPINTSFQWHTK